MSGRLVQVGEKATQEIAELGDEFAPEFAIAAADAARAAGLSDEEVVDIFGHGPQRTIEMSAMPIQLTDAAFLMLRKAIGLLNGGTGLRLSAADIVPAAELIEAEYATVHDTDSRPELRANPAGVEYMKMIDALTGSGPGYHEEKRRP